ncbi:MAG: methyltransferase [Bacteroidales bacterium]|nr:methyltransferase [Bacteroidales bacterium]
MNILDANIGSAKDNMSSPVHNWYKFTAGFSYKFVDIILEDYKDKDIVVYEPFAGCGTTLVECQKLGFRSIGNESQELMCNVIHAKLNWTITKQQYTRAKNNIKKYVEENKRIAEITAKFHPLLVTLYDEPSLRELYCIRDGIKRLRNKDVQQFFNLALSQTLHKAAIHPIAVPYISRSTFLSDSGRAWEKFQRISEQMYSNIQQMPHHEQLATVYNWDSRVKNEDVADDSCGLCITSPPYLNNLDYGEVSKVHSHFFEMTNDWNDITEKVRRKLVTGATTHYRDTEFVMEEFTQKEFAQHNSDTMGKLVELYGRIKENAKQRKGKKSFHILMMHYFEDMYYVLKEMRRVLRYGGEAYLVLGDSAPYGIYVPTTQILGDIALSAGFTEFSIHKIRSRGDKWKNLKNRHNISLSENILILK